MKRILLAVVTAVTLTSAFPDAAMAQYNGTGEQRANNADERADLRDRMDQIDHRISAAQASQAITRTRASELRRNLVTMRQSYRRATRGQGFVSAAESATYNRTLDSIDAQLPPR